MGGRNGDSGAPRGHQSQLGGPLCSSPGWPVGEAWVPTWSPECFRIDWIVSSVGQSLGT